MLVSKGRQTSLHSSSHHLKLYLDTQRLLLNSRHARGKGLPHAGGPSQGQLGNAFEAGDGAGQNSGSAGSVHEQGADDFPTRDTPLQKILQCNTSHDARLTSCVRLTFGSPAGGSRHWWRQDSAWHSSASRRCRTLPSRCRDCGPAGNGWAFRSLGGKCDLVIKRGGRVRSPSSFWADMRKKWQWNVSSAVGMYGVVSFAVSPCQKCVWVSSWICDGFKRQGKKCTVFSPAVKLSGGKWLLAYTDRVVEWRCSTP